MEQKGLQMESGLEGIEIQAIEPSAMFERSRAQIEVVMAAAKRNPRSIERFRKQALAMATLDEEIAGDCIYAVPRGGKTIEGPSVRLAEIVASAWGNLVCEAFVIGEDRRFVTTRANVWDVEANVMVGFEVRRRITVRGGDTFNDDMITVATNAAGAIAFRNAVFKAVPSPIWRWVYREARKVAVGDASTLANRRANMLDYFQKAGASNERVFIALGVAGTEDITLDHMGTLRGIATAIKSGEVSVDAAFPAATDAPQETSPGDRTKNLADRIRERREAEAAATARSAANEAEIASTAAGSSPLEAAAKEADAKGDRSTDREGEGKRKRGRPRKDSGDEEKDGGRSVDELLAESGGDPLGDGWIAGADADF